MSLFAKAIIGPRLRATAYASLSTKTLELNGSEWLLHRLSAVPKGVELAFPDLGEVRPRTCRRAGLIHSVQQILDTRTNPLSLYVSITQQIPSLFSDQQLHPVAHAWLDALDVTGYVDRTVEEVSLSIGRTKDEVLDTLRTLQRAEPAGVFARSLAECLTLQLEREGDIDEPMLLLLENLPILADGRTTELAGLCGVSEDGLFSRVAQLRALDPKPGLQMEALETVARSPDFLFSYDGTNWELERESYLEPTLATPTSGALNLHKAAITQLRSWEQRDRIVTNVVRLVLHTQVAFLNGEQTFPKPIGRGQIATSLGLHETTVGRVANSTIVEINGSRLALKSFFFRRAAMAGPRPVTALELSSFIEQQIARNPSITDRELRDQLSNLHRVKISRRTVTKYRNPPHPMPLSSEKTLRYD